MRSLSALVTGFRCGRAAALWVALAAAAVILPSCATKPGNQIVISVREQKLVLLQDGERRATYPVSTSKYGVGDDAGSYKTPLGRLEVAKKIGGGAPLGAVFKSRKFTGEILQPNAPGRDPIVTRIIWLRGKEERNKGAYHRFIYIHGTPEERNIGLPVSYGCIRMKSKDVIDLYDRIGIGTQVQILEGPLPRAHQPSLPEPLPMRSAPAMGPFPPGTQRPLGPNSPVSGPNAPQPVPGAIYPPPLSR